MKKWCLPALMIVGVIVLMIVFKLTKKKEIGSIARDLIEAAHSPRIKELQTKMEDLSKNMGKNLEAVVKAEHDVEKKKAELKVVYEATGLTSEEIASRFAKLKI